MSGPFIFSFVLTSTDHPLLSSYRLSCYKCITDTMQELVNQSKAAPQSPSVPKQPRPPVMTSDPNMLSNEDATAHVSAAGRRLAPNGNSKILFTFNFFM